jgi:hypothetical protein
MRNIEEIQHRLEELELELEGVKEWANSAYERYREDKRIWGQADYGEVDAAHSELGKLSSQVNILKWVLTTETKKV